MCLKMSVNGTGFRAIERVKGVHQTTVIYWLKQVGELDELETFVAQKKAGCGQRLTTANKEF